MPDGERADGVLVLARDRTRAKIVALLTLAVVSSSVACSTSTPVELGSGAPAVQPVDGGEGQNQAEVVPAGAVDVDPRSVDPSTTTTTTAESTSTTTAESTSTTTTQALSPDAQAVNDAMCKEDRRRLRDAVDNYRADVGESPTSEADLLALGYIRSRSDLYDVWADGTVVAQNATCG
jgi:hypothetical protein